MKSRRMKIAATGSSAALTLTLLLALTIAGTPAAQAQTFQVLYNFQDGTDGAQPYAGVTMDKAGNLYGTANFGGATGNGTVYKLSHKGSGWVLNPLYSFTGGSDGANPEARVIFGPDGALYGTTYLGANPHTWLRTNVTFLLPAIRISDIESFGGRIHGHYN